LEDKQKYEVHMPMKESLERIQDERLIRIHRSFTVNFDQIDKAYPGMVLLNGGSQVPIGRDYSDVIKQKSIILDTRNRKSAVVDYVI